MTAATPSWTAGTLAKHPWNEPTGVRDCSRGRGFEGRKGKIVGREEREEGADFNESATLKCETVDERRLTAPTMKTSRRPEGVADEEDCLGMNRSTR